MKLDTSVAPEIAILAGDPGAAAYRPASGWAGPAAAGPAGTGPAGTGPAGTGPAGRPGLDQAGSDQTGPATIGYLAACLRLLLADPASWWGLVRFDAQQPVRVAVVPPGPGCEAWLLVLPPGYRGSGDCGSGDGGAGAGPAPDGQVTCLVAGAMCEQARTPGEHEGRPLVHGRILVRGGSRPVQLGNTSSGYAVSLHARPLPPSPSVPLPPSAPLPPPAPTP